MKEIASGGAVVNYLNQKLVILHFLVTAQILRLVQHVKLSGSVQKTCDTQMQEVQAPGADSSSQGSAYILRNFVHIKSETAQGNGEGKT